MVTGKCVCAWRGGLCISAPVSCSSPPPSPATPLCLSSYYSHSALEGRQRTLNALCCLLHCLCCFSVPVPHSLPIFVFINHNGCLLRVSWWLFFFLARLLFRSAAFVFRHQLPVLGVLFIYLFIFLVPLPLCTYACSAFLCASMLTKTRGAEWHKVMQVFFFLSWTGWSCSVSCCDTACTPSRSARFRYT